MTRQRTPRPPYRIEDVVAMRQRLGCAPRWRIQRVDVKDGTGTPLWVWMASPYPIRWEPVTYTATRSYGRRIIKLPEGAVLAATWREAADFALYGRYPDRLHTIPRFRKWCGYA